MNAEKAAEIQAARQSLIAICDHFKPTLNGQGSQIFHQTIADKLSALAEKDPPWSHRYIVSVKTGKVNPSQAMIWAIKALGYMLDDGHPFIAKAIPTNVMAYGNVKPGALILGDSRSCAYPACAAHFVPKVPWQRFCSPDCRIKNYALTRGTK